MTAVIVEQPKVTAQIVVEDTTTRVVVTPKTTLQLVLAGTQGPAGPVGPPGPQGSVAGTDGQIQYNDGGGAFGGAADFYYDDTTDSVGIGTSTPAEKLNVIGNVEATEFIGNLRGPVLFKAQASETLAKGDAVYISGVSGQTPTVAKADSGDSAKMPSFGLVTEATNSGNPCEIVTFGTFSGYDTQTPGWSLGDTLYVNGAGQLQNTPPTGENNLIQNIGKVQRIGTGSGRIKVGGAGRTNATPNLDVGKIFAGNASNQAVSTDTAYIDIANSRVGIGTTSPTSKLHVYQNFLDTGSYPELVIHGDANTNMVRTQPKLTFRNSSGYGTYDAGAFSFDTLGRMQTFVYNTTENIPRIGTLLDGDSNLTLYHPYAASSGIFFNVAVFNGGDRYVKVNRQLATNHKGGNLRLVAGDAYTTSINLDGGNLYAYGGLPNLNGAQGNVILGHDGTSAIGKVGIGTSTPPTKFTIQSDVQPAVSGTDFSLYGTTDHINYDRLHIYKGWWGPYVIKSEAAGTATQQSLSIGSGNTTLGIDGVNGRFSFNSNLTNQIQFLPQTEKVFLWYGDIRTTPNRDAFTFNSFGGTQTTAGTSTFFRVNPVFNPSSGNANFINALIAGTINQTGTASGSYTALKIDVTETSALGSNNRLIDAQVDGVSKFTVDTQGAFVSPYPYTSTVGMLRGGNGNWVLDQYGLHTEGYVGWGNPSLVINGTTTDVRLYRDDAGVLAQRNGTNAQEFRVYGTYTDASNYERISIGSDATSAYIHVESSGTGVPKDLQFKMPSAGDPAMTLTAAGSLYVGSGAPSIPGYHSSRVTGYWGSYFGSGFGVVQLNQQSELVTGAGLQATNLFYSNGVSYGFQNRNTYNTWFAGGSANVNFPTATVIGSPALYTRLRIDSDSFSATSTQTITDAATLYISDAPQNGTNVTVTNPYSLYINNGTSYFGGNVGIGTSTPTDKLTVDGDGRIQQYSGSATGDGVVSSLNLYSGRGTEASPTASVGVDAVSQPSESDINFVVQTQSGEATAAALKFVAGGTVTGNGTMSTTGTSSEIQVHVSATNGLVDRVWTFRNDGAIVAGDGTNSRFAITQTGFTNLAQDITIAQTYGLVYNHPTIGGSFIPGTTSNGTLVEAKGYQYYQIDSDNSTTGTARYSWRADGSTPTGGVELMSLNEDRTLTVTGTIEHRNSTTAQTYNIYNTYTDASNYERVAITANGMTQQIAGTGTFRDFVIQGGGNTKAVKLFSASNGKVILETSGNQPIDILPDSNSLNITRKTAPGATLTTIASMSAISAGSFYFKTKADTSTNYTNRFTSGGSYTKRFEIGADTQAGGQYGTDVFLYSGIPGSNTLRAGNIYIYANESGGTGAAGNLILQHNGSSILDGNVGIGTSAPTAKLDVNDDTVRVRNSKTPLSATDTGNQGDICWDANYVYVCIATNTWVRSALSTW